MSFTEMGNSIGRDGGGPMTPALLACPSDLQGEVPCGLGLQVWHSGEKSDLRYKFRIL